MAGSRGGLWRRWWFLIFSASLGNRIHSAPLAPVTLSKIDRSSRAGNPLKVTFRSESAFKLGKSVRLALDPGSVLYSDAKHPRTSMLDMPA